MRKKKRNFVYFCCSQQPVQPVIPTVKEPTTAPIGTKDIDIKHKVLLLGSGLVTGPVVDYLMRDQSIRLTIGKQGSFFFYQNGFYTLTSIGVDLKCRISQDVEQSNGYRWTIMIHELPHIM